MPGQDRPQWRGTQSSFLWGIKSKVAQVAKTSEKCFWLCTCPGSSSGREANLLLGDQGGESYRSLGARYCNERLFQRIHTPPSEFLCENLVYLKHNLVYLPLSQGLLDIIIPGNSTQQLKEQWDRVLMTLNSFGWMLNVSSFQETQLNNLRKNGTGSFWP